MPDLPRPAGEKQQGSSFVTHESMGRSLGSQKRVLGRVIGVEKRLGNAEKKITIMKNILKMRKSSDNIGNTIKGIAESVESIAETTTQQYDLEKDKAEDARISGEKSDAKKDESNLEKGWGSFKGAVGKVLKPVTNMFSALSIDSSDDEDDNDGDSDGDSDHDEETTCWGDMQISKKEY